MKEYYTPVVLEHDQSKQSFEMNEDKTALVKIKENKSLDENDEEVINNSRVKQPSPNTNNENLLTKSVAKVDTKKILGTKVPRQQLFKKFPKILKWPRKIGKKKPTLSRIRQETRRLNKIRIVS